MRARVRARVRVGVRARARVHGAMGPASLASSARAMAKRRPHSACGVRVRLLGA